MEMKYRMGVPLRKIQELFLNHFGIVITPGALSQANDRMAARAGPTFEAMKEQLRMEAIAYADETGWRISYFAAWAFVVCSMNFTIYDIARDRNTSVVRDILGEHFDGILMRDGYASYDKRLDCAMLRCLHHLRRNAEDIEQEQDGAARQAPFLFQMWVVEVLLLKQQEDLSDDEYAERAAELTQWFDWFVSRRYTSKRNLSFAKSLNEHRDQILPILVQREFPGTNNLAERQIKYLILLRKIMAGNKTDKGAITAAILLSLVATCRQQGTCLTDVIEDILRAPIGQAVNFWDQNSAES
jgi:transposase